MITHGRSKAQARRAAKPVFRPLMCYRSTAQFVRDAILADVQRFTRDAVQADDMALVVLVRE